VDGIENKHADELVVIRLNIQEPVGRTIAEEYGFQYTPTFVLLDSTGNEVLRQVGAIDPQAIEGSLEEK